MIRAKEKRSTWMLKNESMSPAIRKCTAAAIARKANSLSPPSARTVGTTDRRILDWAGNVTPAWLEAPLRYTSKVDGRTRELPRTVAVVQLFNHGTQHRGQLTTLIRQAGRDPGETDLPWLPGVVRLVE